MLQAGSKLLPSEHCAPSQPLFLPDQLLAVSKLSDFRMPRTRFSGDRVLTAFDSMLQTTICERKKPRRPRGDQGRLRHLGPSRVVSPVVTAPRSVAPGSPLRTNPHRQPAHSQAWYAVIECAYQVTHDVGRNVLRVCAPRPAPSRDEGARSTGSLRFASPAEKPIGSSLMKRASPG